MRRLFTLGPLPPRISHHRWAVSGPEAGLAFLDEPVAPALVDDLAGDSHPGLPQ